MLRHGTKGLGKNEIRRMDTQLSIKTIVRDAKLVGRWKRRRTVLQMQVLSAFARLGREQGESAQLGHLLTLTGLSRALVT